MKKNLKNLFTEDVQAILTDETLTAIEEAFNAKVEAAVEAALLEQDELYAAKLQNFYTAIDTDHTKKMKRIVEAVDKSNASKLIKIVKLYEREHNQDANKFKKSLVESISEYLEEYLVETVGAKDLAQAVKNRTAYNVLENMRKVLSIDSFIMTESVQEAVIDGKNQIVELQKENAELKKQFKALYEQNKKTEVTALLESKISKFPEGKKSFIKKVLEEKDAKFIEENFDYTVRLFDKQEKSKLTILKEDALSKRIVQPDVIPPQKTEKVIEEKVNKDMGGYLHALSKGKGLK